MCEYIIRCDQFQQKAIKYFSKESKNFSIDDKRKFISFIIDVNNKCEAKQIIKDNLKSKENVKKIFNDNNIKTIEINFRLPKQKLANNTIDIDEFSWYIEKTNFRNPVIGFDVIGFDKENVYSNVQLTIFKNE